MKLPRLYAVTDEKISPGDRLIEVCEVILDAGIRMLQVRFKTTPFVQQAELGLKLRELTRIHESILIVNDNPELATKVQADGVHLGADDPDVPTARSILGPGAIIGVSCYDRKELVQRWSPGEVSYIGLSSPYPSAIKSKATPDIDTFRRLVSAARVPVYAIGGITPVRVSQMIDAGCYGVAAVSAIFGAEDPVQAVFEFNSQLEKSAGK
jgi:thiamine-phosphate pyrophosphorylase